MNRPSRKAIAFAISAGLSVAASVGIALHRTALTNEIGNALANLTPMQTARANPPSILAQANTQQSLPTSGSTFKVVGAKDGIAWGTGSVPDSPTGGILQYSVAQVGATGYFYGSYKDDRFTETYFANLAQPSPCGANATGYKGFKSVSEIPDASKLTYTTTKSILIGAKKSNCYAGLIVLRQEIKGSSGKFLYMVIDPVAIEGTTLKIRWWANVQPDVANFSTAVQDF
jgi:hypothetical protein